MGMLILGGMLISRLMAFYTLLDLYEDARSRRD